LLRGKVKAEDPSANSKPAQSLPARKSQLSTRFNEAFLFAAKKHAAQTRKHTRIPYIAHLMSVAALVLEAGGDEDLAIAALLHDVVEDCGGKPMLEEVRRGFGNRVAHVVAGCTDADTYPKPPWRQRKEIYLQHLKGADADVRLVSAADKLHNVREILKDYREGGELVWQRFKGKREGTLWYYRALADELSNENNWIVRELQRVVSELEHLTNSHEPGGISGKGRD
jgi:(p)ppGpp synthase/HD superfamily hydrolase